MAAKNPAPTIRLTLRKPRDPERCYQTLLAMLKSGRSITVQADELLCLRIRVGLAEGDLSPEQVEMFFGDLPIGADALGETSTWPQGLYSESFELVKRLRRAQALAENREAPPGAL